MDFARVYELHKFFSARRYPIPRETIQAEFGYGRTTFHHLVTYMQDYLDAPIQNSRGQGYYYALREGEVFELPGLWLNAQEMMALALLEQVSADIQPELVKNVLSPIRDKLESLLSKHKINKTDWQNRLKVITQWQRDCEPRYFMNILQALLSRKQLRIIYWKWKTAETSERVISPQRIVYYRNNWYLDAWCHNSQAIKTFSLDAIREVDNQKQTAYEVDADILNKHLTAGYGIFSGQANYIAKLKFTGNMAKRVSKENWHPDQQSEWTLADEYLLTLPYSQPYELIRDIMSYGSNVEVLGPEELKQQVKDELEKTLKKYS